MRYTVPPIAALLLTNVLGSNCGSRKLVSVDDHVRGASCLVAAALLFASMAAAIKVVAGMHVPNGVIVFFRNLFGLAAMLPWLVRRGLPALATAHPVLHVMRGLAGLASMYCFFFAIGRMHLADVMVLNYTAPLFVPLLALVWLREPVAPRLWLPLGMGFAGIVLTLKPGPAIFSPMAVIGLASGMFAAVTIVVIRGLAGREPNARTVFYYSVICTLGSAGPLAWTWQAPSARQLLLLSLIGVLATGGQLLLTRGFTLAPAARVGPFMYTAVIFATLIGWGMWREVPDGLSLTGAVLICLAGVLAMRFMDLAKKPQPPR